MEPNQDPWSSEDQQTTKIKEEAIKTEKKSILPILSLIFSIIMPVVGLVLSIITLHLLKLNEKTEGRKLALTGLIISISILVLSIIFIILFFVLGLSLIF